MDVDLASFEFARAYLQARRHQATGSVRIPIVKDQRGKLVAVGHPVEWSAGVAAKVLCNRYDVELLETADCYKILHRESLETLTYNAPSPQKHQLTPDHFARQRSSTIFERMRVGVYKDQGPCPYMEDGHIRIMNLISPGPEIPEAQSLYCVIDGHGGGGARDYVQDHLADILLARDCFADDPARALSEAFKQTDLGFLAQASSGEILDTSGATVLCVLIRGSRVFVANAGDCRAVACKQGKPESWSTDHKPEAQNEMMRIEAAGGTVEFGCLNGMLRVSRAIGDIDKRTGEKLIGLTSEPEVNVYDIGPGLEFMILATDGIWDVLKPEQAVNLTRSEITKQGDPEQAAEKLGMEALTKHTEDNLCTLIISFFSEEHLRRIQAQAKEKVKKWVPRHRSSVDVNRMLQELRAEDATNSTSGAGAENNEGNTR